MPARKKARHNPPAKVNKAPDPPKQPPKEPTPEPVREPIREPDSEPAVGADEPCTDNNDGAKDIQEAGGEESAQGTGNADIAISQQANTPRSTKSWYGSWPRTPKAAPVAQVVNESITATGDSLAKVAMKTRALKNSPNPVQRKSSSSSYLSPGASTRSLPVTATTTKLNISSEGVDQQEDRKQPDRPSEDKAPDTTQQKEEPLTTANGDTVSKERDAPKSSAKSTKSIATSVKDNELDPSQSSQSQDMSQSTWLGWFGRSDTKPLQKGESLSKDEHLNSKKGTEQKEAEEIPSEVAKHVEATEQPLDPENPSHRRNSDPNPQPPVEREVGKEPVNRSSWLGIWGAGGGKPSKTLTSTSLADAGKAASIKSTESAPVPGSKAANKDVEAKDNCQAETSIEKATQQTTDKPADKSINARPDEPGNPGSSWAFWSRAPGNASKETLVAKDNIGQLAVEGAPSQSQPEDAVVGSKGMPEASKEPPTTPQAKKQRPVSVEFKVDKNQTAKSGSTATAVDSKGNTASAASASDKPIDKRPRSRRDSTENLLLPLFKQTYPLAAERWSLLQQISRLFYGKPPPATYPSLMRDPPQIKNALAIGVHGYFPGAFIQTVLGRPTGTSIRFAESAAGAIQRFTQDHGYSAKSVEKIALEGEGKIEERLDILWKLLLNWIDTIRKADFILVACHSQGVPVAISLVAKLIGFGCVNGARIGICAMAGVNLGPFIDYKSRWISGSAGELFEFAKPESRVSQGYETALDTVLRFGAKVSYIGSLDDQLVSLHSSTFGTIQHSNIYRAVWIDGRLHIPDFLTHLVGFALKLRNLGISDHGLIRELSNPLAGSLVGGEGHSRIYDDSAVYDLAVEFALETTSLETDVLKIDKTSSPAAQNPYILPFAMRGLLEEDFVRKELSRETGDLLKQFDDWKPQTKVLRDVKYRLEGIRSKL